MLVKLFFEFVGSCDFIGYVSGDGTLNIIELAQAIESDHTLTVLISLSLSGSRLALLLLLEHLVLSEDVRLAWGLRGRSAFAGRMSLFELLESACLESTTCSSALLVLTGNILIESVPNALTKCIDTSVARSLWLLIADTFVVLLWVVGLGAWCQFDRAILGRHLSLAASRCCSSLADVGAASLWNCVILTATTVWPLLNEPSTCVLASACKHRVSQSLFTTWA